MNTIVDAKSDFVIQLKSNQTKLVEHVRARFAQHYEDEALNTFEQSNKGHGRSESRTVMKLTAELPDELKANRHLSRIRCRWQQHLNYQW